VPVSDRGQVWLVDLGLAAKVRPAMILSVLPTLADRDLVTLVPHTTSVRGTQYEVAIPKPFLQQGAFDGQGLVTVAPARLLRRLGSLTADEIADIESAVKHWLGF
jgi:mRNA interferase MazF